MRFSVSVQDSPSQNLNLFRALIESATRKATQSGALESAAFEGELRLIIDIAAENPARLPVYRSQNSIDPATSANHDPSETMQYWGA